MKGVYFFSTHCGVIASLLKLPAFVLSDIVLLDAVFSDQVPDRTLTEADVALYDPWHTWTMRSHRSVSSAHAQYSLACSICARWVTPSRPCLRSLALT